MCCFLCPIGCMKIEDCNNFYVHVNEIIILSLYEVCNSMKQQVKKVWPPAVQRFAIPMPIILACIAGLLGALVVIVGDLASASIPAILKPYLPYAWPILGVLLLLGIGVAIWDAWYSHRQSARQAAASQPASSSSTPVAQPASTPASTPIATTTVLPVPAAGSSLYHTCVLSYATEDELFVQKLYADLQSKGISCWYAPHDLRTGDRLRPKIYEAIRKQEKLLLILSEHAIENDWVEREVVLAFERERQPPKTLILFPIRLDDAVMYTEEAWAGDIRRMYFIGDFRQWQDDVEYQQALQRLLRDLHA